MKEAKQHLKRLLERFRDDGQAFENMRLCCFLGERGKLYAGQLMVVGRAINGRKDNSWRVSDLRRADDPDFAHIDTLCDGSSFSGLSWMVGSRSSGKGGYNPRKSAFLRVIGKVVERLAIADNSTGQWPEHIAWTNLYKVSPAERGNPTHKLRKFQIEQCRRILKAEVDAYRPTKLLFITGLDWADRFLELLNFPIIKTDHSCPYVQAKSRSDSQTKVVVACRPERKPTQEWVEAVMEAFAS